MDFVRFNADWVFSAQIRERFDIIGFDPRGVGRSSPVRCFDSAAAQHRFFAGMHRTPVTDAEERDTMARLAEYSRRCGQRNPSLLAHMSTSDIARDMDRLRALVGDRRLTYVGFSSGTFLGAVYANLFPRQVRAMVLDGVMDPVVFSGSGPAFTVLTGRTAGQALDGFAGACAAAGDRCVFAAGATGSGVRQRIDAILNGMKGRPMPAPPGDITYSAAVATVLLSLYAGSWVFPMLASALAAAEHADGSELLTLARLFGVPDVAGPAETYNNYDDAFSAIYCGDSPFPRDAELWPGLADIADRLAPHFGRRWLYRATQCATWPAAQLPQRYTGPWNRSTAAPVLAIGTRHDPATPLASAQRLGSYLADARVVVHEGYGHTSLAVSSCVDSIVERYVVAAVAPASGTVCHADTPPFLTAAARGRDTQPWGNL